jgi:hypothetical protein
MAVFVDECAKSYDLRIFPEKVTSPKQGFIFIGLHHKMLFLVRRFWCIHRVGGASGQR